MAILPALFPLLEAAAVNGRQNQSQNAVTQLTDSTAIFASSLTTLSHQVPNSWGQPTPGYLPTSYFLHVYV
jgi:hypothetical protein